MKKLLKALILSILIFTPQMGVNADSTPDNATKVDPIGSQKLLGSQVQVGEFTGATIYSYPIQVPPGRNGMTPSIQLSYNSQDESLDNNVGYHWSLTDYSIKRINKTGVEKLYNENNFSASTPTESGELRAVELNDESHGRYGQEFETTFSRYEYTLENSWIVTDKSGTRHSFGLSEASRIFDPQDPTRIYEWKLEEIRDRNDNFIHFSYLRADNQLYLKEIAYTGHGTEEGIFKVKFLPFANNATGTKRPDGHYGYHAGFYIGSYYLVNQIEVYTNDQLRRKYDIEYTKIEPLIRQTINQITETGFSLEGQSTALPPTKFEYSKSEVGWEETNLFFPDFILENCHNSCNSSIVHNWDMDGNGLEDFEYKPINSDTRKRVINIGSGQWIETQPEFNLYQKLPDIGEKPIDFNGDGRIDIVTSTINSAMTQITSSIKLSGFGSFLNTIEVGMRYFNAAYPDNGASIADLNGDGLPDLIQSRSNFGEIYKSTCLNDSGNSCKETDLWESPKIAIGDGQFSQGQRQLYVQDCNFDGLSDVHSGSGTWINDGKGGWITGKNECHFTMMDSLSNRSFDANGDGLIDRIQSEKIITYGGFQLINELYLDRGLGAQGQTKLYNGIFPLTLGTFGNNYFNDDGVRIMDLNGDKLPDIIQSQRIVDDRTGQAETNKHVYLNIGSRPYFLKKVITSTGGEIEIEYKTSSQYYKTDGSQANPKLPFLVDTVSKMIVNDGMGNQSETNYFYEDGHYYFENSYDKEYAGFRVVTKTDALGYQSKNYYHQSQYSIQDAEKGEYQDHISKRGQIYRTETYDLNSQLVQSAINQWNKKDIGDGRYYPHLTQTVSTLYDGTEKSTAQTFEYDEYGNVITAIDYGEVLLSGAGNFSDIGEDSLKNIITYTRNEVEYLPGLSVENKSYDQNDHLLSHSKTYYDGLSLGEVSKGNNTKNEIWLNTNSSWLESETEYNEYGLPRKQTNPKDFSTLIEYEENFIYPQKITNAKGHISQATQDIGTGNIIFSLDPNGLLTENRYDGLGRTTEILKSNPKNTNLLTQIASFEYFDATLPRSVSQKTYNDNGPAIETFSYLDGLNRTIEKKQETSNGKWTTVASIFDERGNLKKSILPYFSATSNYEAVDTSQIGESFEYDALNRVVSKINPLGITVNNYNGWENTMKDANGILKTYAFDARNNLIRVDEHNGADIYQTQYEYSPIGQLQKMADADLNTRTFEYDSIGKRIFQSKLNSTNGWTYEYDENGNLTRQTDPMNIITTFDYDELDRLTNENNQLSYSYDNGAHAIGRLVKVSKTNYDHSFNYDLWGRATEDQKTILDKAFTNKFEYDLMGGVVKMTYPDESVAEYIYDNAHQLSVVKMNSDVMAKDFEYTPLGQLQKMELGNGVVTTLTYDENQMYRNTGRTSLLHNSVKLQKYGYKYDALGNLMHLTDENNGLTAKTVRYEYDDLNRLIEARYEQTANYQNVINNYQYNSIGNMVFKSDVGSYEYGNDNPHAVSKAGEQVFAYDMNGNMITRNDETMEYDYKNHLIRTTGIAEYDYGEGYDRITKKNLNNGEIKFYPSQFFELSPEKEVKYIYAGSQRIAKIEKQLEPATPVDPPVENPTDPVDPGNPTTNPPDPVNPPPTPTPSTPSIPKLPTINSIIGNAPYKTPGSQGYKTMEDLNRMLAIRNIKTPLSRIKQVEEKSPDLMHSQTAKPENLPKNFRPEVKSDVEFVNLRINYNTDHAEIQWDAMHKEVTDYKIYRSRENYPKPLSKDPTVLIGDTKAHAGENIFTDNKIENYERFTYRVIALNSEGKILATSIPLHALQIFIAENESANVDFQPYSDKKFNKIYVYHNDYLNLRSGEKADEMEITPIDGFEGGTDLRARFLNCKTSSNGTQKCDKLDEKVLEVYVIKTKADQGEKIGYLKDVVQTLFASLIPTAHAAAEEEKTYYYLYDHLGSVDAVLDEEGNVVERADYLPYGEDRLRVDGDGQSIGSPLAVEGGQSDYKFTGQELDSETGLYYYGARYYDPLIGRFVSSDPWEGDLSNPQTLNKYSYVLNNPLKYVDPSGAIAILLTGFSGNSDDMESLKTQVATESLNAGIESIAVQVFKHNQQFRALFAIMSAIVNNPDEPVVLVGHSWGGDSAIELAEKLGIFNIQVQNLIQIDSVGLSDEKIPDNVLEGVNFYQEGGKGPDGAKEVDGSTNINIKDVSHTDIDKNKEVVEYTKNTIIEAHKVNAESDRDK